MLLVFTHKTFTDELLVMRNYALPWKLLLQPIIDPRNIILLIGALFPHVVLDEKMLLKVFLFFPLLFHIQSYCFGNIFHKRVVDIQNLIHAYKNSYS